MNFFNFLILTLGLCSLTEELQASRRGSTAAAKTASKLFSTNAAAPLSPRLFTAKQPYQGKFQQESLSAYNFKKPMEFEFKNTKESSNLTIPDMHGSTVIISPQLLKSQKSPVQFTLPAPAEKSVSAQTVEQKTPVSFGFRGFTRMSLADQMSMQTKLQELNKQSETSTINSKQEKSSEQKQESPAVNSHEKTSQEILLPEKETLPQTVELRESEIKEPQLNEVHSDIQTESFTPLKYEEPSHQTQQKQDIDIHQMIVDNNVKTTSALIESWVENYKDSTSNMYVQENLKDDIVSTIFSKDSQGKLQLINQDVDRAVIEKLIKKYEKNEDILRVLHTVKTTLNEHVTSHKPAPQQTNKTVAFYYTEKALEDIFAFIHIEQSVNAQGKVTNIPTIESIIQEAKLNPSPQALKALQAAYKTIDIAIYASRNETSMFSGDSPLLEQLKIFKDDLHAALQNPRFTQPQSWKSYAASFLPSAETVLYATGLGNIKTSTLLNTGKSTIETIAPYTGTILNISGVGKKTLSEIAESTGIIKSEKEVVEINPIKTSLEPLTLSRYEKGIKEKNDAIISQQKSQANAAIEQYLTPAIRNDIVSMMATKSTTGAQTQTRKPLVEEVIETALKNPSQESFTALQRTLEATQVAIYANKDSQLPSLSQLKTYEKEITAALQNPIFTPFQSWSARAQSSIASAAQTGAKSILDSTGLGDVTVSQVYEGINAAHNYAQHTIDAVGLQPVVDIASSIPGKALNYTGIPEMSVSQVLTHAGVLRGQSATV